VDGVWWCLEGVTHESSSRPGPSVAGKGALGARVRGVPPPRCNFCTNPDSCGFREMWMKIKKIQASLLDHGGRWRCVHMDRYLVEAGIILSVLALICQLGYSTIEVFEHASDGFILTCMLCNC
jgi:hypothetical protein